ncbi:hypothetical protein [Kitasatospora sp. NPDC093102]
MMAMIHSGAEWIDTKETPHGDHYVTTFSKHLRTLMRLDQLLITA